MMKKGYWIGRVDVENAEAYQQYVTNGPAFAKFGGRFIVRGGSFAPSKDKPCAQHRA